MRGSLLRTDNLNADTTETVLHSRTQCATRPHTLKEHTSKHELIPLHGLVVARVNLKGLRAHRRHVASCTLQLCIIDRKRHPRLTAAAAAR